MPAGVRFVPVISNPTRRVLDVLNFFAAHPTESFTLTEIARHLGQSPASALRVLSTMADEQFLARNDKHKTYSLGMAPVAVGQAAINKHRGIAFAHREMATLANEIQAQCSAIAIAKVGDELLVLVKEGTAKSDDGLSHVGDRRLMIPPFGICHVAWGGAAAEKAYLEMASRHLSEGARAHLLASFPLIRRRGYAMVASGPGMRELRRLRMLPIARRNDDWQDTLLTQVGRLSLPELQVATARDAGPEGINYIAAPVFSPTGTVPFQVVVTGLAANLDTRTIEHHAGRLCAAAAVITSETHGCRPMD